MEFKQLFKLLHSNEGNLSLDPKDRGNWTTGIIGKGELRGSKFGVSAMSFPELDIRALTLDEACKIYEEKYWKPLKADQLPDVIHFELFDTAVNSGVERAIKLLQKTVGSKEDGILGSDTISKANSYPKDTLRRHYSAHRLLFMTNLSAWESQGKGWARRIANNLLI